MAQSQTDALLALRTEIRTLDKWHLTNRKSRRIAKRLEPLMSFIEHYSSAVDVTMQGAVSPAALVWGCLRAIIMALKSFGRYLDSFVAANERLGALLSIYSHYEIILGSDGAFRESLSLAYSDVIAFMNHVKSLLNASGLTIFCRSLWQGFHGSFHAILPVIEQRLEVLSAQTTFSFRHRLMQKVEQQTERLELISRVQLTGEAQNYRDESVWLPPVKVYDQLLRCKGLRVQSSGSWLFSSQGFQKFATMDTSLLWIFGPPGCGKTVLSGAINEYLHDIASSEDSICYFYFDYLDQDNRSLRQVCRTLIAQLLASLSERSSRLEAVVNYTKNTVSAEIPEPEAINLLLQLIHSLEGRVWIILDGFDESPDLTRAIKFFSDITQSDQDKFKAVILSRDVPEIRRVLQSDKHSIIDFKENSSDIYAFLTDRIEAMELETCGLEIQNLIDRLYRDSQGCFEWANMIVQHLKTSAISLRDVRRCLEEPVPFMHELFSKCIAQLSFFSLSRQTLSRRLITWICCAQRRMTLEELQGAMAICSTSKTYDPSRKPFISVIRQVTSTLFEIDDRSHIVRPFHTTAELYLTRDLSDLNPEEKSNSFYVQKTQANQEIANDCLILLHDLFTKSSRELLQFPDPIACYACSYWLDHLLKSELPPSVLGDALRFLESSWRTKWSFYFLFWQRRTFPLQRLLTLQDQLRKRLDANRSGATHHGSDWALDIGNIIVKSCGSQSHLQDSGSRFQGEFQNDKGFSHFEIMMVIRDLARHFTQSGRISDAINLYDHALAMEPSLPRSQREVATEILLMNTLGILLDQTNELDQAIDMQNNALRLLACHHPPDPVHTQLIIWTKNELGRLYRHRGSYSVALSMHYESLSALEQLEAFQDGTLDLEIAWTRSTLARCLRRQRSFDEAISHTAAALAIRKRILGLKHPHSLWLSSDIAQCHFERGDYEMAEIEHRRIQTAREQVLGPEHPDTLWTSNNLGIALESSGGIERIDEALTIQKRALAGQEKVLGVDHSHTRWTRQVVHRLQEKILMK